MGDLLGKLVGILLGLLVGEAVGALLGCSVGAFVQQALHLNGHSATCTLLHLSGRSVQAMPEEASFLIWSREHSGHFVGAPEGLLLGVDGHSPQS